MKNIGFKTVLISALAVVLSLSVLAIPMLETGGLNLSGAQVLVADSSPHGQKCANPAWCDGGPPT
jgi:prepilin-type processing-associated H-X9-DG protein